MPRHKNALLFDILSDWHQNIRPFLWQAGKCSLRIIFQLGLRMKIQLQDPCHIFNPIVWYQSYNTYQNIIKELAANHQYTGQSDLGLSFGFKKLTDNLGNQYLITKTIHQAFFIRAGVDAVYEARILESTKPSITLSSQTVIIKQFDSLPFSVIKEASFLHSLGDLIGISVHCFPGNHWIAMKKKPGIAFHKAITKLSEARQLSDNYLTHPQQENLTSADFESTDFAEMSSMKLHHLFKIYHSICEKLKHIHNHGIIHADLHPNNIFIDENLCAHIIDFNLSLSMMPNGYAENDFCQPFFLDRPFVYRAEHGEVGLISYKTDIHILGIFFLRFARKIEEQISHTSPVLREVMSIANNHFRLMCSEGINKRPELHESMALLRLLMAVCCHEISGHLDRVKQQKLTRIRLFDRLCTNADEKKEASIPSNKPL